MNNQDSPQQTLQNYFDELLLDVQPEPNVQAVPAPQSKPESKSAVPARQFVEPVPQPEHRAKVEKLLQSVRAKVKAEPVVETPVAVTAPAVREVTAPAARALKSPPIEEVGSSPASPKGFVEESIETRVDEAAEQEHGYAIEGLEWLENGLPEWAQERFDVLLFKVSGLTLAVPLIALGQIQPITDELTPIFGQADWFMGLLPTPAGKIRTVNTAKFVMPERYDERFVETAQYVISINGLPWGLAVDSVNQPITLDHADVKWRSERSKRAWLAGTVKEHMCALIDIPRMGKLLMDTDKNLRASP